MLVVLKQELLSAKRGFVSFDFMFIEDRPLRKHFYFLFILSIGLSYFTVTYSHMNNWLIFRSSFFHLWDGLSLYTPYPQEHNDLYKYSPTFAFLMAPLALLPAKVGAILWNLLGAWLFSLALKKVPVDNTTKKAIFWISLPEFIGSTQGFQSNIHLISLLILFWVSLENERAFKASLSVLLGFFIKIFGLIGLCLFTFSKYSFADLKFFGKFIFGFILSGLILFYLPIILTGYDGLMFQYEEWQKMLKSDVTESFGFSIMGVFHWLTGLSLSHLFFQVTGAIILMVFLFLSRNGYELTRLLGFISVCYFLILFNHRSESPTFIIAMVAFGIHQSLIKDQTLRWLLIIFTLTCVSILYADPFRHMRTDLDAMCIKAWPFIILWPMALYQMFKERSDIFTSESMRRLLRN